MDMKNKTLFFKILLFSICILSSCKKFIEIDAPKNSLVPSTVFKSNDLATSAVLGIYQQMAYSGYASIDNTSISTICAVSSDEFIGYENALKEIYETQYTAETSRTNVVWSTIYQRIYDANAIIEGLGSSDDITPPVKSQLLGETLFIRAFNYLYLVNLFGGVPLQLSTNYEINGKVSRAPVNEVYNQIIKDLKSAEQLLGDTYITTERVRPNKVAVAALLARTYLYMGEWENAEKYATYSIEKTNTYKLVNLDQIFLNNSLETIWQLIPPPSGSTPAGAFLILTSTTAAPIYVSLRPDFAEQAFETGDQRKTSWVRSIISNGITYYYPFKYKVQTSSTVIEYNMVLRIAEQYLIRAEARAKQNNLSKAIDDLDAIRSRAGLLPIKNTNPNINQDGLLLSIQKERRIELFSEWGHRWFDLKRTGESDAVFSLIKPNWKSDYVLFPIPNTEVRRNKNIIQNKGY